VAGIQIDGYFPDTSTTNGYFGWFHDAQFVIRLPDNWNGKLVITGAPGVRRQYANDYILSDWFVSRGYAYASTDKGNSGTSFHNDGVNPGDAIAEWHRRVTELTVAAKEVVRQRYGALPAYTYMTGLSNGGYLTRYALENRPAAVRAAVANIALIGRIGKPMITLHGTLDSLLPMSTNSDNYVAMIHGEGRGRLHRYYVVEAGNHVDQLYDEFPDKLRPITSCYRAAFIALENWVQGKGNRKPPASKRIARVAGTDLANQCSLD